MLREGKLKELPVAELVVGDIVQFKCSDTFPVDGILMEVCQFSVPPTMKGSGGGGGLER